VFEQAPPEIDNFIQPSDSKVFAECLDTFEVSRFELDDPKGSPRSFSIKFGFKENEYFEDKVLEKKFWFRRSRDWAGLVSEPVLIHWKKGKDLTGGLTDAAYTLSEAKKKLGTDSADMTSRKKETKLPEYQKLAEKLDTSLESSISFFGLFAFVSGYRWISAEESEQVEKDDKVKLDKIRRGEKVDEDDDEEEEDTQDHQENEVFPGGDEVVTIIAEDMWPNAIKYYSTCLDFKGSLEHKANISQKQHSTRRKTTKTCQICQTSKWSPHLNRTTSPCPKRSTFERWLAKVAKLTRARPRRSSARPEEP
jgi:hypothetical protein